MQGPWLIILTGHQYSGKSTLAARLKRSDNEVLISTDNILFEKARQHHLSYSKAFHKYYDEAKLQALADCNSAIVAGKNVIVDRTNMYPATRKVWLDAVPGEYLRVAVVCNCSEKQLAERMAKRSSHSVTMEQISESQKTFVYPTPEEGFDHVLSASDLYEVL